MKTMLAIIALSLSATAATLTQEPASFTVARSELTNQYAVLSWTLPAGITNTVIYRAFGEGGPWTEIAETNDCATTWTDATAPLGVPCWYKIAFAEIDAEEVRIVGNMCAATVSHRRCQLLERDWEDMSHLKDGVTLVWNAKGKIYNNGDGVTPAAGEWELSASYAFDGNTATHPNIAAGSISGRSGIGVNLGSQHLLEFVRCNPRTNNNNQKKAFNGHMYYGSNDQTLDFSFDEPAVTEAAVLADTTKRWYELASTNRAPFRFFYGWNPSNTGWCLGICEIQFYGYPSTAYNGYAIGAVDFVADWNGGATVLLSWKDNGYGTSFNVERSTDGGTTWTAIASGLSATSYTDDDISLDGGERLYRIASVNGNEVSYSATARCVPYVRGDGVGLHRSALFPYISTKATEMAEYVSTGAVYIADATLAEAIPMIDDVEGSHTNVYMTWTGKLIVPFAGSYKFTAEAKGMVSVWINDSNVTRYSAASGYTELTSAETSLAAGEHNIRVVYWQGAADHGFTLYWDGAVAKEAIPVAQLKPVVPKALPEPWEGTHSFSSSDTALFPSDTRVNDDGSFDLAFAGADINYTDGRTRGHNFLWRSFSGDFTATVAIQARLTRAAGEKAGLMVAAGLDSSSKFEAFFLRGNKSLGLRARRASLVEPKTIGGVSAWGTGYNPTTIYMRLRRTGSKFTYSYRESNNTAWTDIYEYDDGENGFYGDTVYIGPVATYVNNGNAWETSSYRLARYAWRFSEIDVRPVVGLTVILK